MQEGALGKVYKNGEVIIRQGEEGDCMYVVQSGEAEIIARTDGGEVLLAVRKAGDFIGEMAIFEKEKRSADVRARGEARLLTVDKKNLLRRIHEDPSLAFRLIQMLSGRVRELSTEIARLKTGDAGSGG